MESVPQICHESISEVWNLSFGAAQSVDLSRWLKKAAEFRAREPYLHLFSAKAGRSLLKQPVLS
jgi:hypothetical protein